MNRSFNTILVAVLGVFLTTSVSLAKRKTQTVKYGPAARHKVKIQFDKEGEPRAINVHFHGGGFTSGRPAFGPLAKNFRNDGMAVAGATYRFIKSGATKREILEDGARAIQFLRLNAEKYNIDPDRISVSGFSAGGVMAAWIALHDDLADPESDDEVLRQSSRVNACWIFKSQVHPLYLSDWIEYADWDPASLASGIVAYVQERLSGNQFTQPFDESDFDSPEAYEEALDEYVRDTFPFYQATPDDPPVAFYDKRTDDLLSYLSEILPNKWGNLLHSPALMIPLQRRLEELGVDTLWGSKGAVRRFVRSALGV